MGAGSRRWILSGAAVVVLLIAVVAWLATSDNGESTSASKPVGGPRIVTQNELREAAVIVDHPVYWAGPIPGTRLELTEGHGGVVKVRYLEPGDAPGEAASKRLAIGTYPLPNPAAALTSFAHRAGSTVHRSRHGIKVVVNSQASTSAYFASPDNSVQVEVYDRPAGRALHLVLSGRIRPLG